LAAALDGLNEAVVLYGDDGQIRASNQAARVLYGQADRSQVGIQAVDILGPLDQTVRQALASGQAWSGAATRTSGAGLVLSLEVKISRLVVDGETLIQDAARDVTADLAAQGALKAAAERNINLFQAMAVAFWDLDFTTVVADIRQKIASGVTDMAAYFAANPDYVRGLQRQVKVVEVNARSVELFGGGDPQSDLSDISRFWPDDSCVEFTNGLLAAMRREPCYVAETKMRRADGTQFDVIFTTAFPPETTAGGRALVGFIDIDAQKQAIRELTESENRYRTLFESSGVAFFRFETQEINRMFAEIRDQGHDPGAYLAEHPEFVDRARSVIQCVDANAAAVRLMGANAKSDLLGPVEWVRTPDHVRALRGVLEAGVRNESAFQTEVLVGRLDGGHVPCLWFTIAPPELRSQGTSFVGLIDISEQANAREAVRTMQGELAHAARVAILGELTASLAHEVAQPISAIVTRGEAARRWLARETVDVDTVKDLLARMLESAERAGAIVKNVRDMARRVPFHSEAVDLAKVARETLAFLAHELETSHVDVRLTAPKTLPSVEGDRIQLQQLIFNLVLNAQQALVGAASADPRVTIRLAPLDRGVSAVVEDNGPGIPEQDLERVFESFRSTRSDGMGMGLSVCRSIVERHAGRLTVRNLESGGASFAIWLPVREPQ
jgi:signal transduction histidine kinase